MMTDFNAAMAAIESGLTATQTAAASALTGLGSGGQNCRVMMGTHVGTDGPVVTLTFPFRPVLLVISQKNIPAAPSFMLRGSSATAGASSHAITNIVWGENSISWTGAPNSSLSFNNLNTPYPYVAIGY